MTPSLLIFNVAAALEQAAFASRLSYDKMSFEEVNLFRDMISDDPTEKTSQFENYKKFLYIRNKILQVWVENPKVQLVIEDALAKLDPHTVKNDITLILRIFKYLERYSYINFGVYKRIVPLPAQTKGKVIVIGAGIAGLMAARQLKEFGFEVVIYEARVFCSFLKHLKAGFWCHYGCSLKNETKLKMSCF
jgi:lysine-specific histone demethylase 1